MIRGLDSLGWAWKSLAWLRLAVFDSAWLAFVGFNWAWLGLVGRVLRGFGGSFQAWGTPPYLQGKPRWLLLGLGGASPRRLGEVDF